jgi:hypothetical protein
MRRRLVLLTCFLWTSWAFAQTVGRNAPPEEKRPAKASQRHVVKALVDTCGYACLLENPVPPDDSSGGVSQICRATYGVPSTYCFSQTWTCDANGNCIQKCARTLVSIGYCSCVNNVLKGSCNYGYVPPPTPY